MRSVRGLLAQGNLKLGRSIFHFDLPAVTTCPGRSPTCERVCYARESRFHLRTVKERLDWCFQQSLAEDFAGRMAEEIYRKGVLVVRLHVSGDFFNAEYAAKWLEVMRKCPTTRYYFYTRSWQVPEIANALEHMAGLECCRAWYSIDRDTGPPSSVPPGVRLAYLQVDEADLEVPDRTDLMFRVRRLRRQSQPVGLPLVCPSETPLGRSRQVNCGNCAHCWKD